MARETFVGRALAAALAATDRAAVDGFAMKRGLDDAVEAAVEVRGRRRGRFVVAVPRSLLPELFASALPAPGETDLVTALGMFALSTCTQVLYAKHDTMSGVELSEPALGPAGAARVGEIVIPIGDSWLAANLLDADAMTGVS